MPALRNFQCLIGAVELIDEGHSAHRELPPLGLRQIAQRRVKSARSEEKCAMQQSAAASAAARCTAPADRGAPAAVFSVAAAICPSEFSMRPSA